MKTVTVHVLYVLLTVPYSMYSTVLLSIFVVEFFVELHQEDVI